VAITIERTVALNNVQLNFSQGILFKYILIFSPMTISAQTIDMCKIVPIGDCQQYSGRISLYWIQAAVDLIVVMKYRNLN
jgi:hypothetical protein